MDGFTGDQRFFMGWAQVWRRKYTDANLLNRLKSDPHSPSEFRCNGVVANIPAFYSAFDVKEGDKMYLPPEQRVNDRKSVESGKSVSVRVDLGGRSVITKKKR